MIERFRILLMSVLLLCGVCAGTASAEDRLENLPGYDRYKLLNDSLDKLAVGGRVTQVEWSENGRSFTFKRDHKEGRFRFDLDKREVTEIPTDPSATKPADSQLETQSQTQPETQPQSQPGAQSQPAQTQGGVLATGRRTRRMPPGRGRQHESETSPDGQWTAASRDYNVIIESAQKDQTINITTSGTKKFRYGKASWVYGEELDQTDAMWWSPDSKKLAFYEFDERQVKDFYLLRGWSDLRTEPVTEGYPKPGEPNPIAGILIYDLMTSKTARVQVGGDLDQYVYNVQWTPDGSELLFSRTNRH